MTMTRTILLSSVVILGGGAGMAQDLNIQTSFNAGDFSTKYLTENWLPKLEERTDGRLSVTLTPSGSIVPARETPEAVAAGVIDGDFTSVNYFSGLEPAYAIMGDLISGYETPRQMLDFCRDDRGEEMMQKAADEITGGEVHVVGCGPYSREALVANVPIRTYEDLAGKKIRSPEGLAASVFQAAGASPISIPFSEVFGALEKGIVDAADASAYVNNDATGLHDVAPYPLYPGIHSMPAMQFTVSERVWEEMAPEDQEALRQWWYDAMYAMAEEVAAQDQQLAERDNASDDIEVIDWSDEDRMKLRETARTQWEAFAEKSDLAQEALDAHVAYLTEIGLLEDQ